jgi:hypothetical protein
VLRVVKGDVCLSLDSLPEKPGSRRGLGALVEVVLPSKLTARLSPEALGQAGVQMHPRWVSYQ